jgi:hypothetical protein
MGLSHVTSRHEPVGAHSPTLQNSSHPLPGPHAQLPTMATQLNPFTAVYQTPVHAYIRTNET